MTVLKNKYLLFRYVVIFLLVASIFIYFSNNIDSLKYFKNITALNFICLTVSIFFMYIFASINLFILLKARQPELSWLKWIRYYLVKRFLNMHVPQAGNIYEAVVLRDKFDINLIDYGASFSAVNWIAISFNLGLITIFSGVDYFMNDVTTGTLFVVVLTIFLSMLIMPFFLELFFRRMTFFKKSSVLCKLIESLHKMLKIMKQDLFSVRIMLSLMFWSSMLFVSTVISLYYAFQSIGVDANFWQLIPFVLLSLLMSMISIIPGNIGVGEYAFGFLGAAYNMDLSAGIILSIVFRVATYLLYIVILMTMIMWNTYNKY
jgi:uncharacterized membrane protein YbhN (UPF0104 family)